MESTDQALWLAELLPAYRAPERALSAAYAAAAVHDYPSAALGETYSYPSGLADKLYINARVSQAFVVMLTVPVWRG
ncbi:MAG: hypothetical protein MZW92_31920 [Comamonadaceae bacterium]|nr:hypothetical protein [Comamonadaceae bacterium]